MTEIFDCYVERPTKEEAIEIVERAVDNGVECWDAVEGVDVTAKGRFYEYDKYEYWGVNVHRGTYTNDMPSSWAEKATQLTMDEYRAKFPCEKYDGKTDEWPKVGEEYILTNDKGYILKWCEGWIGEVVVLQAVFKIGNCAIAAVQNKKEQECACFRLDMLKPIKTDREWFIESALAVNSAHMWTENEFLGALYDVGFKAPENNNENT